MSNSAVRAYWTAHIHDLDVSAHQPGSREFFRDLDEYHFEKLHHLLRLIDFEGWRGRDVLDAGCGAGVEVVRFARGGARVTGLDLAATAVALTRQNLDQQGLRARLVVGDAEALPFPDAAFDFVYAHGVMQYTTSDARLIREAHRVLRPGGLAMFQAYNRHSWLNALSRIMHVPLEHEDAPVLRRYSITELRRLLGPFRSIEIVPERFPVPSRLHKGWKGAVYNRLFVGAFNALPRGLVRRFGWHLLAFCTK